LGIVNQPFTSIVIRSIIFTQKENKSPLDREARLVDVVGNSVVDGVQISLGLGTVVSYPRPAEKKIFF